MSDILDEIDRIAKERWYPWCEFYKAADILCLQRATVWLPVKIGEDDPEETHGFCDHHAGVVIGAIIDEVNE